MMENFLLVLILALSKWLFYMPNKANDTDKNSGRWVGNRRVIAQIASISSLLHGEWLYWFQDKQVSLVQESLCCRGSA